jgi:hypothetical protein
MAKQMSNARLNIIQGGEDAGSPMRFILTELLDMMRDRVERAEKK